MKTRTATKIKYWEKFYRLWKNLEKSILSKVVEETGIEEADNIRQKMGEVEKVLLEKIEFLKR